MTAEQKATIKVLRYQGFGYASIARQMGISIDTVKSHCRRNNLTSHLVQATEPTVHRIIRGRVVAYITVSYGDEKDL